MQQFNWAHCTCLSKKLFFFYVCHIGIFCRPFFVRYCNKQQFLTHYAITQVFLVTKQLKTHAFIHARKYCALSFKMITSDRLLTVSIAGADAHARGLPGTIFTESSAKLPPTCRRYIGDFDHTSHPEQRAYRIYSNERRPGISAALE